MLQDFQNITLTPIDPARVLAALSVAFVCGLLISLVYRWSYKGASYAPGFVRSMIFLAMITAVVMMVIGNNLARAFGLVGAMSIIRFRTALKDPQDIVFVFFALSVGLAAGVGMYSVALVSTVAICAVILITTRTNYAALHKPSYLLQITYEAPADDGGEAPYLALLKKHTRRHRLINVRQDGPDAALDLTFYVDLRRPEQHTTLTRELSALATVTHVNLFFDDEQL